MGRLLCHAEIVKIRIRSTNRVILKRQNQLIKRLIRSAQIFSLLRAESAGLSPVLHYVLRGFLDGKAPSARFNVADYLERHPEVRAAGVNPLLYYIIFDVDGSSAEQRSKVLQ